jgi:hypothetical protein
VHIRLKLTMNALHGCSSLKGGLASLANIHSLSGGTVKKPCISWPGKAVSVGGLFHRPVPERGRALAPIGRPMTARKSVSLIAAGLFTGKRTGQSAY